MIFSLFGSPFTKSQVSLTESDCKNLQFENFISTALGAELGSDDKRIKKWTNNIQVFTHVYPTEQDLQVLTQAINEVNSIVGEISLSLVTNTQYANLIINFVPHKYFEFYDPNFANYESSNRGFFWVNWNGKGEITKGNILIDSDSAPKIRSALVVEMLTRSLGLMQDYPPNHTCYEDVSYSFQRLSPSEKNMLEILYLPKIKVNMTKDQIIEIFPIEAIP